MAKVDSMAKRAKKTKLPKWPKMQNGRQAQIAKMD